jgi:hypothetical protein
MNHGAVTLVAIGVWMPGTPYRMGMNFFPLTSCGRLEC